MKNLKKLLMFLFVLAMVFAFAVPLMADETAGPNPVLYRCSFAAAQGIPCPMGCLDGEICLADMDRTAINLRLRIRDFELCAGNFCGEVLCALNCLDCVCPEQLPPAPCSIGRQARRGFR
jgi:hypothetical protein